MSNAPYNIAECRSHFGHKAPLTFPAVIAGHVCHG